MYFNIIILYFGINFVWHFLTFLRFIFRASILCVLQALHWPFVNFVVGFWQHGSILAAMGFPLGGGSSRPGGIVHCCFSVQMCKKVRAHFGHHVHITRHRTPKGHRVWALLDDSDQQQLSDVCQKKPAQPRDFGFLPLLAMFSLRTWHLTSPFPHFFGYT